MILRYFLQIIGATIAWIYNGFKGTIDNEIAKVDDYSWKRYRNYLASIIFIIVIKILLFS